MAAPLDGLTLSLADAATLLMLSPRRLQQLTKDGHAPKPERGRYPAVPLLQGYLRFLRAQDRVSARDADDELKRLRVERERVKLAADVRDIVMVEDVQFHLDQFAGLVNLHVNNIPARFTRDLDTRDRLQETIDEALHAVAAGIRKCGEAIRACCDEDPADTEGPED